MNHRILLIRTGGTIDSKVYEAPFDLSNPPPNVKTLKGDESLIMQTVSRLPNAGRVDHFSWVGRQEDRFVKDSKEFTPEDIGALAHIILDDSRQFFVITHGTDWMVKNAMMLQELLRGSDKVVVFTGAMVPLSMQNEYQELTKQGRETDAVEALRYTLERISHTKPGVYIAGRDAHNERMGFLDPDKVEKDTDLSKANLAFTLKSKGR